MAKAQKPKKQSKNVSEYQSWSAYPLTWILVLIIIIGGLTWVWTAAYKTTACNVNDLELTAGPQQGAAGTIYQDMYVKNTGKKTCTVAGYPTAILYGVDGYASGSGAAATPSSSPKTITLGSGQQAKTTLGYPQAGNFDPGICSAKSTKLKLYPAAQAMALEIPLQVAWCPGFSSTAFEQK